MRQGTLAPSASLLDLGVAGGPATSAAARDRTFDAWPARIAWAGVCVLLVAAPFERLAPLVRLPGQRVSDLEAVILVIVAAWIAALVWTRTRPSPPRLLALPWAAALATLAVSAAVAPSDRANAARMVARFGVGLIVATLATNGVTSARRLIGALSAALAGGVLVASLIVFEYFGFAFVAPLLAPFHASVAVVGAIVRASGPFQYPTIASMYLEIVFALGLGVLLTALEACPEPVERARRRAAAAVVFVALGLIAEAIMLTFTRAGIVSAGAALACAGVLAWRDRRGRGALAALGALAAVIAVLFAGSRSAESIRLRITSEGQEGWYVASFTGPAELRLATRSISLVEVTVRNDGKLTWDSDADSPVYLSYHWLEADSTRVVSFEGLRTPFAAPVDPGRSVTMPARVEAPPRPGKYQLAWDVVQEHRLWFSTEPGARLATTPAVVSGPAWFGPAPATKLYPASASRPGRAVLWRAALGMIKDHPILGVGPDNFRLRYGAYAGLGAADRRIHSNNLYLELLAGGGLAGGLACLWLLWRATRVALLDRWRACSGPRRSAASIGIAGAWMAILLHGLVDSFVSFTSIYLLMGLTLGFAAAVRIRETAADANRF